MLDQALEALNKLDWGGDFAALKPIDDAIVATHGNAQATQELEAKLAAVVAGNASRCAKDYACRKLSLVASAHSVPALAALLPDAELSHMARFVLERIPAAEAGQALRDALAKVSGGAKLGVISSLGARKEPANVAALASLLADGDAAVARAAALALGEIRGPEAAQALAASKPASPTAKQAAVDARLACGESLLAAGKKVEALAIYKSLIGEEQPKHIKLAATRGMLACAGK